VVSFEALAEARPLDHFVSEGEERVRNGEAERSGCLEIDKKLGLGGLHYLWWFRSWQSLLPHHVRPNNAENEICVEPSVEFALICGDGA
jgi:hypothetical protein